ncbi:hypothetical protein CASFOL_035959 [Castilleja foliolosa]|uniref:SCP domain-containing protein n=1 Tax=Castilleja foliolosa TaxID=1961234 RepID=A0ABD3BWJ1_9LAMI
MEIYNKSFHLAILFFIALTMLQHDPCLGTPQEYLDPHNAARAEVGVGPMVWDENVAAFAQSYANSRIGDCKLAHSGNQQYGENIAEGSGDFTSQAAVGLWVGEKSNYDHASNTCVGGECRHYTQVVWRNSVRLGCARVQCSNNGWWFVTCNYDPPGNYQDQSPY